MIVVLGENISLDGSPGVHVGEGFHLWDLADLGNLGFAATISE